jgi:hypothetical protein
MAATLKIGDETFPLAIAIPSSLDERIEAVEVEFVHDGKGKASVSGGLDVPRGIKAKVTERVQQAAPPHAIVVVRTKRPERDEATRVRQSTRVLDRYGTEPTYTANGVPGLALNERNSIPLLGLLPQGDAPKAVSEGVVATG